MSIELRDEAAMARARVAALGLTQQEIAIALRLEQSQVSRLLAGKLSRRTAAFDRLCRYLRVAPTIENAREIPDDLIQALLTTWDGSRAHADALATVIRALGVLSSSPVAKESDRDEVPNPS